MKSKHIISKVHNMHYVINNYILYFLYIWANLGKVRVK